MTNGPLFMGCQFQAHDAANSTAQCKSHLCYHYFFPSFLAESDTQISTSTHTHCRLYQLLNRKTCVTVVADSLTVTHLHAWVHDVRWQLSCPSHKKRLRSEIIPALAYQAWMPCRPAHMTTSPTGQPNQHTERKLGTLIFDLTDSTMMMSAFPVLNSDYSFLSFEAKETKPLCCRCWCCWDRDRHGSQLDPAALHMAQCHRCMAPTYLLALSFGIII